MLQRNNEEDSVHGGQEREIGSVGQSKGNEYLREFFGSPGPMLTCSTLLLGLRIAKSPWPCINCTWREPPALHGPHVSFFSFTSSLLQTYGYRGKKKHSHTTEESITIC